MLTQPEPYYIAAAVRDGASTPREIADVTQILDGPPFRMMLRSMIVSGFLENVDTGHRHDGRPVYRLRPGQPITDVGAVSSYRTALKDLEDGERYEPMGISPNQDQDDRHPHPRGWEDMVDPQQAPRSTTAPLAEERHVREQRRAELADDHDAVSFDVGDDQIDGPAYCGRYIDWSTTAPDGDGRVFEIGNEDGDTVVIPLTRAEMRRLHAALAVTLALDDQ